MTPFLEGGTVIGFGWQDSWVVLVAYGLGCFSTGYYLVKWRTGKDIRGSGSGATGARNVARTLGRSGFLLTVVGDIGKGVLAVGISILAGVAGLAGPLCALAVTTGHIFPAQLRFSGGKGVATALGALATMDPKLVLGFALAAGIGLLGTRRIVAAGLVGFLSVAPTAWLLGYSAAACLSLFIMVLVIFLAHRRNITFLLQGKSGFGA